MIVIFAVALIVVGPDKLPGLARSLAKGLMEMKKTLNQVKENLTQEGETLDSVQKDLRKTADELREKMIDVDPSVWKPASGPVKSASEAIIDVEPEALADEAEILSNGIPPVRFAASEQMDAAQQPDEPLVGEQPTTTAIEKQQ